MAVRRTSAKGKLILLSFLFFLFIGYIFIKLLFLDKKNDFGELKVISTPSTNIFLDTVNIGKTPFDDKVRTGEYMIKLIADKEASGAAAWQGKVNINKNSVTYINRELGLSDIRSAGEILSITKSSAKMKDPSTGELQIDTDPVGALVYLDNDEKGIASLLLQEIPKGSHDVSVYMPGFFKRTFKVNIESQYKVSAQVKLAIDEEAQKELQASPSAQLAKDKYASSKTSDSSTIDTKSTEKQTVPTVLIKDTPTGWLRVRYEPNLSASEAARINPGDKYSLLEEKPGWYKIPYEEGKEGWISSQYAEKTSD